MLTRDEMKAIYEEVRENHKKLNSCKLHNFVIDVTSDKAIDKRYRCTNCNGEVSSTSKYWYDLGLKHAKNL